ncbi:phosphohistidine swiveling domain-containing protein [Rhodococcus sp. 27YEA15]|uniref:PEP-utilizing enzyme n=1 Tax=Rhodococcus sp. 27YEA15 TaxID=3156259 RepID=UPI003C7A113F
MIGVPERSVQRNDKVLRNMVGLVSGRVYYNIDNWYRVLRLVPFFDRNKEDVEKMIGVENPVDFIEGIHPSVRDRLAQIPRLAPVAVGLGWRMLNRTSMVENFQSEVGAAIADIRRRQSSAEDLVELVALADDGLALFERWAVQILNDLYLSNQTGRARRILEESGVPAAEEMIAGLLASEEAVESLQPTLILMRLAASIRGDKICRDALFGSDPRSAYEALCAVSPRATVALRRFVELYGDRCIGEQKLETISFRQDPSFIVSILRNYVDDDTLDPEAFERSQRERQARVERTVLDGFTGSRRRKLEKAVRKARLAMRDRERMRLNRTRIVGVGRSIYLRVGELLFAAGQLDDPRQVFHLTMDEIKAFAEGRSTTSDLAAVARARIEEFARYEEADPPNQFETLGPPTMSTERAAAPAGNDGRILRGTGCWPQTVEGAVQVVLDPADNLDVRGKILTTVRTDPGWGPLFPSVKGLLIERGSTLSHSAVLSRELGIPAVVGIPGLMSIIRDGERVRLDGGSGIVERLDEPED